MSGGRFNFPRWNYGYTLGPPTQDNAGNYTQFYMQPQFGATGGTLVGNVQGGGARPPMRGGKSSRGGGGATANKESEPNSEPTTEVKEESKDETKSETAAAAATATTSTIAPTEGPKEEGEIVERPLSEILRGRNPIMFCNDQSKYRNLHMEWEQVSETGPPHDKTFTWSLKMGEIEVLGSSNSKKGAKNKAAEEMVKKLDQLPKAGNKRQFNQAFGGQPGRGGGRGRGRGGAAFFGAMPPPNFYGNPGNPYANFNKKPKNEEKKKKKEPVEDDPNKPLHPAQNNPISKLYEFTKKRKLPEPVFEVVQEEVLETRQSSQGFKYKKTKFTIQCEIMGKKFSAAAMDKKSAKFNAAVLAWAEVGFPAKREAGAEPGVQASIDSLLQSGRQAAEAAAAKTA